MVELKTRAEIDPMADAGAVVDQALRALVECAKPGMTTVDLDRVAADGWTLLTLWRARPAHSEHTVALTTEGPASSPTDDEPARGPTSSQNLP